MRTLGIITVGRSDYGIYLPLLRRMKNDSGIRVQLVVSGMHLSPEYGLTVKTIEQDGFEIVARVEMLLSSDTPQSISKSIGLGTIGYAETFSHYRPDILVVLGDRFEMHAAVVASLPFRIPVAHLHGGEITEGAIDDVFRHSITKMSHLHFVSNELHAQRLTRMGEEPWRVEVSGAPSLDNIKDIDLLSLQELECEFCIDLRTPTLLVTYHPVTMEYEETENQVRALLNALIHSNFNIIFTLPNADTNNRVIIKMIRDFTVSNKRARLINNLGTQAYFSFMKYVTAMVGNSSSGIIEAASFELPVVNIGNRQRGRLHGKNVINVGYAKEEILVGIETAVSPEFRKILGGLSNPYGDGNASERIISKLRSVELNDKLLLKHFYNS